MHGVAASPDLESETRFLHLATAVHPKMLTALPAHESLFVNSPSPVPSAGQGGQGRGSSQNPWRSKCRKPRAPVTTKNFKCFQCATLPPSPAVMIPKGSAGVNQSETLDGKFQKRTTDQGEMAHVGSSCSVLLGWESSLCPLFTLCHLPVSCLEAVWGPQRGSRDFAGLGSEELFLYPRQPQLQES